MSQNCQSIISFIAVKSDFVSPNSNRTNSRLWIILSLFFAFRVYFNDFKFMCYETNGICLFFFSTAFLYTLISCFHCDYFCSIFFCSVLKTGHPSWPHDTDNLLSIAVVFLLLFFFFDLSSRIYYENRNCQRKKE